MVQIRRTVDTVFWTGHFALGVVPRLLFEWIRHSCWPRGLPRLSLLKCFCFIQDRRWWGAQYSLRAEFVVQVVGFRSMPQGRGPLTVALFWGTLVLTWRQGRRLPCGMVGLRRLCPLRCASGRLCFAGLGFFATMRWHLGICSCFHRTTACA